MADSIAYAVQKAIYNELSANANLTALLAEKISVAGSPGIYDRVIQPADTGDSSHFPYVIIGDDDVNNWSTDTASGGEVMATVHAWSRARKQSEVKNILGEVYNSLHRAELTVTDHEFIGAEFENQPPVVLDPDQITFHGTITFRILVDEVGYGE